MRGDLRVEEVEGARVSGGARRARSARGVVIPRRSGEKTRGTRFCARGGEREGARRRAPERGQRSYLPTALRSRPRPSSEKLGEYASTILSCGASVMGGRASGVESSRKRPTEKRASRSFDRVRGAPIASFEARPGSYCPLKPKHSPFIPLSFLSVSGNPKGREMQTFMGNNSKGKPWGFSKLVGTSRGVHRTWHVKAAVRRCAARARRETRGTARDARSTDGRVRDPRETRARRVPRALVSRCARAPGRNLRRISRSPLNERSFRPRKVGCARAWPYRRVERPRGVRSNLGSDLGRFRAPCERRCAKSCATRDEVSGERASRPRLSRVCFVCAH